MSRFIPAPTAFHQVSSHLTYTISSGLPFFSSCDDGRRVKGVSEPSDCLRRCCVSPLNPILPLTTGGCLVRLRYQYIIATIRHPPNSIPQQYFPTVPVSCSSRCRSRSRSVDRPGRRTSARRTSRNSSSALRMADVWASLVSHVRDHVIKPQTNKCKHGPPHCDNLRDVFASQKRKKAGKAVQPISPSASQKDHVPVGVDHLFLIEAEHLPPKRLGTEDATLSICSCQLGERVIDGGSAYPAMSPTISRLPARLPRNVMFQCMSAFHGLSLR